VSYEWDPKKAANNLRKHGVDFADAVTALEDEQALTLNDDHPDEQRFITVGTDVLGHVLVIVYTFRGEKIRIISAREATPRERRQYTEGL
jgi:uncharacterized DUF497 family protein